jgi:hypothetical protein
LFAARQGRRSGKKGGGIMKNVLACLMAICLASFIFSGCGDIGGPAADTELFSLRTARAAGANDPPLCAYEVNLIAGRTLDIGAVRCWIEGNSLHVLYSAEDGWLLGETQLAVALSRADIPLTNNGNPKVGKFPFKKMFDPPVAEVHYSIDLETCGLHDAGTLVIAAHAEAVLPSGSGGIEREEGAWAEGERFVHPADAGAFRLERPSDAKVGNIVILEEDLEAGGNWAMYFTVDACEIKMNELVINEVFFPGSCSSSFYFYDQFVELYNPSSDTLYLDNIIVTRQSQIKDPDMETKGYVSAIYAFQLKGTGRQYPIAPGQHAVIAADAVNHKQWCANSPDLSPANPDLSHAPGEPYKLYEAFNALGNDYDTPGVPNFESVMPGKTTDFLINLSHNAVVIAEGGVYPIDEGNYMRIPLDKVIDGVEYASNPYITTKEMTVRIDAGFAGIGITRYSAMSTERRAPGFDTNDSTFDFVVIPYPTPGLQYGE